MLVQIQLPYSYLRVTPAFSKVAPPRLPGIEANSNPAGPCSQALFATDDSKAPDSAIKSPETLNI